jgi:phytoene desaturase (3,4-didehydrolycopene-forming)
VLVPTGHLTAVTLGELPAWQARARATVLRRMRELVGVDLERHIVHEEVNTPLTWRDKFNLHKGAALGLSHNISQVGFFRPRTQHEQLRNLFFVGASVHPGTGVPIVLCGARMTAAQCHRELSGGAPPSLLRSWVVAVYALVAIALLALVPRPSAFA